MKDFGQEQIRKLMDEAPELRRELRRNQYLDRSELQQLQDAAFVKMVRHAYVNVPFYRKKYDEAGVDIESIRRASDAFRLPILEKEDLIEAFPHRSIADGYSLDDLTTAVTGGSSGTTVRVAYSDETMRKRVMTAYRIYDMMMGGYHSHHVQTYVYTGKYPLEGLLDGSFPLVHIWTLDPVEDARRKLLDSKPHMLTLYPSRLEDIRRGLTPQDVAELRENLVVINVKSEMSTQAQRDAWAEFFGVPVLDEYGSEEMAGTVAAQCPDKGYHIWEDIAVVEVVDEAGQPLPDGETGELVATCLYNWAMPMIRYRQGDIAALHPADHSCSCGRTLRQLKSFEGRRNSSFTLPSGRFLSSGYLLDVGYTRLMAYADALDSWSLVQRDPDLVVFECIPGPAMNDAVREAIQREVSELLFHETKVQVEFVDALRTTNRGKRNQIISLVP
ncbi:phenylacetate--CoA ligase family protein [Streptomyces sp. 24-1644]|uniref:phenylacetate--CoA ligase family protein n=1 Tax=Streptomyces sp. 24-1644 TaxID=3457315 RepID=UPI003FA687C7